MTTEAQAEYLKKVCETVSERLDKEGGHLGSTVIAAHKAKLAEYGKLPMSQITPAHFERIALISDEIDGTLRDERLSKEAERENERQSKIQLERTEAARLKAEADAREIARTSPDVAKALLETERMKAEAAQAQAEAAKAQAEAAKMQAEAAKAQAEVEKYRAETERLKLANEAAEKARAQEPAPAPISPVASEEPKPE